MIKFEKEQIKTTLNVTPNLLYPLKYDTIYKPLVEANKCYSNCSLQENVALTLFKYQYKRPLFFADL